MLRYLTCLLCIAAPAASAQPTLTSGRVSQTPVDVTKPNASPALALNITGVAMNIVVQYQSPSGMQASEQFFSENTTHTQPGAGYTGHVLLQGFLAMFGGNGGVLSLYAEPGTWTLTNVAVCDATGCNSYNGTALTAVFPKITFPVVNPGTPDLTPPAVVSATLLTPTVSISQGPQPAATVHATDNLSGVNSVTIYASLPNYTGSIALGSELPTRPARSGPFNLTGTLQPNTPTGTYTINGVILLDNVGNTTAINDPAALAKLFNNHLTITVTN